MADIFGTVAGGLMNMMGGVFNNYYAQEQIGYDRQQNYKYGEMAANNADKRTRALYADFYSPEALKRQYREAGLSPGMMFGGTPGQGGISGAQGTGAAGPTTPYMPVSILEAAQAANLMAQTEKTKAETQVIKPLAEASIQQALADAGLKRASTAVADAEAAGLAIDNYVKENTKEASIYQICELADKAGYDAQKAFEEMRTAKVLADVNEATYNEQVELRKKEVAALAQSISESKSMQRLNEEQRKKVYNDILQAWEQIDINWKELEVSQQQADTYTEWINKQIPIIEKQLEAKFKELDIEKKRMVIDAVTGTLKSLAFGAMATASFKGGKGSDATPPGARETLERSVKRGGNAVNKGVPPYKSSYTWDF